MVTRHVLRVAFLCLPVLASAVVTARAVGPGGVGSFWRRLFAAGDRVGVEKVMLFVVTVALGLRYVVALAMSDGEAMPGLSAVWIAAFGASCGVYSVAQAIRVSTVKASQGR